MSAAVWCCPADPTHLCAAETYEYLGFCPYCHITREGRVLGAEAAQRRKRAVKTKSPTGPTAK